MRRFDRILGIAFVTLAAAFFIGISPVSAKAEEVGISSDTEGMAYIDSAIANMDNDVELAFSPEEVNVYALITYLNLSVHPITGINTYQQMQYAGYGCWYSDDYLNIQFDWKLTMEQEQIFDATVGMLAPYLVGPTEYDTIKNVHDWICLTTDYDDATVYGLASRHSGYNALFEHLAVCDGNATLFQKFMDKLGIPCYCATGNNHAWNIVWYNGAWYKVDCTWDDQDYGIIYKYFMTGI